MYRIAVGLALLGVLVVGVSSAPAAPGVGGPWDRASGAGKVLNQDRFFNVSAQNGPQGVNGHITLDTGPARAKADVNCLIVVGNTARVGGTVTKSNDPSFPEGQNIAIYLEDNGSPGKDNDRFDAHRSLCTNPLIDQNARPLESGNVVVNSAL
jgi:hypothetical protein